MYNILLAFEITFEMDQYVFDKNQVNPIVKLLLRYPEGYVGFVTFPINVTIDKVNAMAIGELILEFMYLAYTYINM